MADDLEQLRTVTRKYILAFKGLPNEKKLRKEIYDFVNEGRTDNNILATLRIIYADDPKEASVVGMLAFLWAYEGMYMTCIDGFCYLLTAIGYDLFDAEKRMYAKSLKDIESISGYTKIEFLKEHGFLMLERNKDRKLRNKIAHHRFDLTDDGKVMIGGEEIDVVKCFEELICFAPNTFSVLWDCLNE